jgi:CBS domain-containing protein
MIRSDDHLNAMLRHLGAAYYDATQGRASRSDVNRALDTVAEILDEEPAHRPNGKPPASHPAARRLPMRRWARQVQDVMTTQVVTVDRITPYKEIARLLAAHKISGVPVLMMGRHVAGVVSETDLVREQEKAARRTRNGNSFWWHWRSGRQHAALTAGNLMTSPPITINVLAPIPSAARLMNTHHIQRLPVVDDDGTLVGIVSRRDLLSVFLRSDQEITDDVREVLTEVLGEGAVAVTAKVRNGIVTLAGDVEALLLVPDRLIWGIDGVVDVIRRPAVSAA